MHVVGITGGSGFIGRNLVSYLSQFHDKYTVQCYDGDVLNADMLADFCKGVKTVIHLAGKNRGDNEEILDVNVQGTYNVVKAALDQNFRLFTAGTTQKNGYYGYSKSLCESLMKEGRGLGLHGAYMMMPNVFGPHCKPFYNSFVSTMMYSIAKNKPYKHLIKEGRVELHLMHVHSVCQAIETFISLDRIVFDEEWVVEHPNRINLYPYGGFRMSIDQFEEIASKYNHGFPDWDKMSIETRLIRETTKWYENYDDNKA